LGDEYSPLELLRAAQSLIELNNSDYTDKTYQDGVNYPGYYSYSVDTMISVNPWIVFANECHNLDFDDNDRRATEWTYRLNRWHRPQPYHPYADGDLSV
jgi:hypothetical protein